MSGKNMHVVFHATNKNGWALKYTGCATKPLVHFVTKNWIAEKRPTVFGRKNEVKINNGKGLRHRPTPGMGRNAVGVEGFVDIVSQGSRCAATLG